MGSLEVNDAEGRRRWVGRLAAAFFLAGGALGLLTVPLLPRDANAAGSTLVSIAAGAVGVAIWLVPWERLPRAASLAIVPPAFALIAAGNLFGGSVYHGYGIFFVVAFVWIGLAHPPWTSVSMVPFAALAYVLPLFFLPGDIASGLGSAAITLPICVVVGEALARGIDRAGRTEDALRREREVADRLRALDAMKDTFMKAASHELRTPITICRGHLAVLGSEPEPGEVRQAVDLVVEELDRMGRLVEDMTTLTRLEDPRSLKIEEFDAAELLRDVAVKVEPILNGRLRVAAGPPGTRVRGDSQRLTQALLNLLQNAAVHAGPDAPVELRLSSSPTGWRFDVADEGMGLEALDEETLFQPFRAGSRSAGSGLGLAIVKRIAQAHGGDAGVVNRGRGATFWIRVPR
jgi:signal transduction histidine kinase